MSVNWIFISFSSFLVMNQPSMSRGEWSNREGKLLLSWGTIDTSLHYQPRSVTILQQGPARSMGGQAWTKAGRKKSRGGRQNAGGPGPPGPPACYGPVQYIPSLKDVFWTTSSGIWLFPSLWQLYESLRPFCKALLDVTQ